MKKEEEFGDDHTESGSSPETLKKFSQNKRQVKKVIIAILSSALCFFYFGTRYLKYIVHFQL